MREPRRGGLGLHLASCLLKKPPLKAEKLGEGYSRRCDAPFWFPYAGAAVPGQEERTLRGQKLLTRRCLSRRCDSGRVGALCRAGVTFPRSISMVTCISVGGRLLEVFRAKCKETLVYSIGYQLTRCTRAQVLDCVSVVICFFTVGSGNGGYRNTMFLLPSPLSAASE